MTTGLPLVYALIDKIVIQRTSRLQANSQFIIHCFMKGNMGKLSPHTVNCYKSRLKKLRKVLPFMPESDPERVRVLREIEKLTNQLGMEMNDLEIALTRGPGRPRLQPDISAYRHVVIPGVKTAKSKEEIEAERLSKIAEIRERVIAANPDLLAVEERRKAEAESDRALNEMIAMANDELTGGNTDERV